MNLDSLFSARLKEERERLNFSQATAGSAVGISREMWGKYERGAMPGGDVIMELAKVGFDLAFLFTGLRSTPAAPSLNPRQRALLNHYDHCDEDGKRHLESTASYVAQQQIAIKKCA